MLDGTEIDLWPFGARLQFMRQKMLEDWEVNDVVCTIDRLVPYGNRPSTQLKVVRYQRHFFVIHTTQDGLLIEYQERPFRTKQQAREYAAAQSSKVTKTGRLWTHEFDGEVFTGKASWDHHIQREANRLM